MDQVNLALIIITISIYVNVFWVTSANVLATVYKKIILQRWQFGTPKNCIEGMVGEKLN